MHTIMTRAIHMIKIKIKINIKTTVYYRMHTITNRAIHMIKIKIKYFSVIECTKSRPGPNK